ncbi:MAG: FAD-binding oxidoreductase [Deltaproteobacteria bacterium]|nr:FAD-binding oxidoreductase [Deltaproteobacteria bacterium]MBW2206933.1 FAD-binding oxidoreductase [Deltaproteobacteria bacterium]
MTDTLLFEIIRNELMDIVGHDDVTVHEAERIAYSTDYYFAPQVWIDRGQTPPKPDWIVFPESVDEISRLLKLASRHRIPVIPYGGGTGSQGGGVPLYGGILLDLKKLNRIIKIDEESYTVTAQAGVNGQHLEWTLNKKGLTLAHYPASAYGATLGGYVAARGTGTLSTKYGKAEDMVLSMEIVLPSGEVIRTLPVPNHACGPGLLPLFVGSEGTLGVITEVTIRLDPVPEERRWRAYLFNDIRKGLEAGRRIMTKRLRPCTIRLYDQNSTQRLLKRVLNLDVQGAYMVVGSDGDKDFVDLEMNAIHEICTNLEGEDLGSELGEHWWKHRYDFYFPPLTYMLPQMFGTVETTTTFDCIYDIYMAKKRVIEEDFKDWGASYIAHFSHWFPWGVMVYDRFIIDKPPQDPHEALQLHTEIWGKAARTSIQHGGTLNDHHGIGFKLGWLMPEQYGTAWPVMQGIKDLLDPQGIMNPGKLGFTRR